LELRDFAQATGLNHHKDTKGEIDEKVSLCALSVLWGSCALWFASATNASE
jgi:hypothetical protein